MHHFRSYMKLRFCQVFWEISYGKRSKASKSRQQSDRFEKPFFCVDYALFGFFFWKRVTGVKTVVRAIGERVSETRELERKEVDSRRWLSSSSSSRNEEKKDPFPP